MKPSTKGKAPSTSGGGRRRVAQVKSAADVAEIAYGDPEPYKDDARMSTIAGARGETIHVPLARVTVIQLGQSSGFATLLATVDKASLALLAHLDGHALAAVKQHASKWFMHPISDASVDDYFRGSTSAVVAADGSPLVASRFKILTVSDELTPALREGKTYALNLRLRGLLFKKQHFSAVWRLAAAREVAPPAPPRASPLFQDDGAESDDADADDAINEADAAAVRDGLLEELRGLYDSTVRRDAKLRLIDEKMRSLSAYSMGVHGLGVLDEVAGFLDGARD
jgi:hypothetical protein